LRAEVKHTDGTTPNFFELAVAPASASKRNRLDAAFLKYRTTFSGNCAEAKTRHF
jgi:hypothetical protein